MMLLNGFSQPSDREPARRQRERIRLNRELVARLAQATSSLKLKHSNSTNVPAIKWQTKGRENREAVAGAFAEGTSKEIDLMPIYKQIGNNPTPNSRHHKKNTNHIETTQEELQEIADQVDLRNHQASATVIQDEQLALRAAHRRRRRRKRLAQSSSCCAHKQCDMRPLALQDNHHFSSSKSSSNKYKSLLLSTLMAIIFLFCSSSRRMSLGASGLSLQAQPQTPEADLNAAILATMANGNDQQQQQQQQQQQASQTNSSSITQSPFKMTSGQNELELQQQSQLGGGAAQATKVAATIPEWLDSFLAVGRIFIMGAIIIGDICGNSLVILSVCRHSKLRVTTNWFVVSLACADILVALFAMTFNASVIISGKWLFKPWVCDFWNSCDVLASTASILHLCCISIDRYVAITRPLDYPMKITTRRVVYCLCVVWLSSALLSYLPIFTGIYTTQENLEFLKDHPDQCQFVVNRVYAIVSSSISFWIPCCIMVFTYYRIYMEASRQEKLIHQAQSIMPAPMPNHHHHHHHNQAANSNHLGSGASSGSREQCAAKQRRSKSMALAPSSGQSSGSQKARIRQLAVAQQLQQFEPPTQTSALVATTKLNSTNSTTTFQEQDCVLAEKQPLAQALEQQSTLNKQEQNNNNNQQLTTFSSTTKGDNKLISNDKNNNNNNNSRFFQEKDNFALRTGNNLNNQDNLHHKQRKLHQNDDCDDYDDFDPRDPNSGQSTPTKRSISKMKREHKAAKTLGIIMGVFILCWLPFFSWYTPMHICGHACDGIIPEQFVSILFWIGYFNSTLNPIIYAYFNSEFRDAFKKTLQWLFCCCQDLKCLRVNRGNDNQHYNCTYRSTQEIVLVSNA